MGFAIVSFDASPAPCALAVGRIMSRPGAPLPLPRIEELAGEDEEGTGDG